MNQSRRIVTILTLALAGAAASPAFAQSLASPPGKASNTGQNPLLHGQRSDLIYEVVSVKWITTPCPPPETKEVLKGLVVKIKIDWVVVVNNWGGTDLQAEIPGEEAGDDFFAIRWQPNGRYTLTGATTGGSSIFAGANPSGSAGGNGTWDGIKVTPPAGFENGKVRPVEYELTFAYTAQPGDLCQVFPLPYTGDYMHDFEGNFRIFAGKAMSVSVGFPWSVSLGGTVSWTSTYCWVKQLVDPDANGGKHVALWTPPPTCIPSINCCPQPVPPKDEDDPSGELDPDDAFPRERGEGCSFGYEGGDLGSGITTIAFRATDPDGHTIADEIVTFDPPALGLIAETFNFTVPTDYTADGFLLSAVTIDDAGNTSLSTQAIEVSNPIGPILSAASGLPERRLLAPDTLHIDIPDDTPGITPQQVSQGVTVQVVNHAGIIVDSESGLSFIAAPAPGLFHSQIPVVPLGPPAQPNDGKLTVGHLDWVQVAYTDQDAPEMSDLVPVVPRLEGLVLTGVQQPITPIAQLDGAAFGNGFRIAVNDKLVQVPTNPGENPTQVAQRIVNLVNAQAPAANAQFIPPAGLTVPGAQSFSPFVVDRGMVLLPVIPCYPDCEQDGDLDVFDFLCFQNLFAQNSPYADCEHDGDHDVFDFLCFQNLFAGGC